MLGVRSRPLFVVGPLVPAAMSGDRAIEAGVRLAEVHELLTVSVTDVGPCRVDVTWDPPLVRAGLPGTIDWNGASDMQLGVDGTSFDELRSDMRPHAGPG